MLTHVVTFDEPVSFTDHTGISFYNVTKGVAGSIVSVEESSPTNTFTYTVDYGIANDPGVHDILYFDHDGTGNYATAQGSLLPKMRKIIDNPHPRNTGHLCHFKCEETAGDELFCSLTGTRYFSDESLDYTPSNAIGMQGNGNTDNNNMRNISEGQVIFYFCITLWQADDPRMPPVSSTKCSLQHVVPGMWEVDYANNFSIGSGHFDLQVTPSSNKDRFNYSNSFLAYSHPLDPDPLSPFAHRDGAVTGAIVLNISESDCGARVIWEDGTTFNAVIAYPGGDGAFPSMPFRNPIGKGIEMLTPPESWKPSFKLLDLYEWGVYNFINNEATDAEIITFLAWLDVQARAGNKDVYPSWIGRS